MGVEISPSARRHGITNEQIEHAFRNAFDRFGLDEGVTMYVGADQTGLILEIGVVDIDGPVAIHAMPARPKYLR